MILLRALRPLAVDFIATFAFLIAALVFGDVRLAILVGLAIGLATIGWEYWRGEKPGVMQWLSVALVVVSGTASLITDNPLWVMLKPTVIYATVGAVMLVPGWMMKYVPPVALTRVRPSTFRFWGYAWSVLMFASAALNLGLALTLDPTAWALAMSVWGPVSKLLLFAVQYAMIRGEARRASLSSAVGATDSSVSVAG